MSGCSLAEAWAGEPAPGKAPLAMAFPSRLWLLYTKECVAGVAKW